MARLLKFSGWFRVEDDADEREALRQLARFILSDTAETQPTEHWDAHVASGSDNDWAAFWAAWCDGRRMFAKTGITVSLSPEEVDKLTKGDTDGRSRVPLPPRPQL